MKASLPLLMIIAMHMGTFGQNVSPLPPECDAHDLSAYGTPVMTPISKDLSLGFSLAQRAFKAGDKIEIHIWAVNSGDAPAGVLTCGDLERFKVWGLDIFDQNGRRVLRQDEVKYLSGCSTDAGRIRIAKVWSCARNMLIPIPPHTCVTRNDYDLATDLTNQFQFPPGEYTLRLRADWRSGRPDLCDAKSDDPFHAQPNDLSFSVTKP
ncbi:MAG: hypothetical protein ABSE46_16455 [Terracidiphilus sp.]|jgi:hypothetical protein